MREMKLPLPPLRVGLFGISLEAYWSQFHGNKDRLEGYVRLVKKWLERPDVEIINLALTDSPERAMEVGHQFRREEVDVIFLYGTTRAVTSTWGIATTGCSTSRATRFALSRYLAGTWKLSRSRSRPSCGVEFPIPRFCQLMELPRSRPPLRGRSRTHRGQTRKAWPTSRHPHRACLLTSCRRAPTSFSIHYRQLS